jgi:hypothetical protein
MSRVFVPSDRSNLRLSLTRAYDLWLANWETALSALTTATQSRVLGANEVAAHLTVLKNERALVTRQFTLLLGHAVPRSLVNDEVAAGVAQSRFVCDRGGTGSV